MATIYVKAKPGRAAFYEGRKISTEDFVPVPDTPYIRRLINHWKDLDVQGGNDKKKSSPPESKPEKVN
jgi:hypothetical protein